MKDLERMRTRDVFDVDAIMADYEQKVNADPIHNASVRMMLLVCARLSADFLEAESVDERLAVSRYLIQGAKELMRAQSTGVPEANRDQNIIAVIPENVKRAEKSLEERIREAQELDRIDG